MRVTVVWASAPRTVREVTLDLPDGATVAQALAHTGWGLGPIDAGPDGLAASIWGRRACPDTPLREGDRLELTRPLRVDPKVARRERFQRQGARAAGLFARTPKR
ncbi:RnfH family protein [Tepidimonas sp.]|uniref:RnfH family protein n=1 Tax=Tepidimonas sp. TaxID=2002775 RepID=UPI00391C92DF